MYFGLYQTPSRHHRSGALAQDAAGPDLFDRIVAWLRHALNRRILTGPR